MKRVAAGTLAVVPLAVGRLAVGSWLWGSLTVGR